MSLLSSGNTGGCAPVRSAPRTGGLGGLISMFEAAGLGQLAQPWISPVSPSQLRSVFGNDRVQQMADQSRLAPESFLQQLSLHLPTVVDNYIIAVDCRVFPSLAIFGAYIGAVSPGSRVTVDYIPSGQGPANAQRVAVVLGRDAQAGMSAGEKVAIGVGEAALLGCYEMGCFAPRHDGQPDRAANPGR
jgi:YidB-like protein